MLPCPVITRALIARRICYHHCSASHNVESLPDVVVGALSLIHIERSITTPLNIGLRVICVRLIPIEPHRCCSLFHRPPHVSARPSIDQLHHLHHHRHHQRHTASRQYNRECSQALSQLNTVHMALASKGASYYKPAQSFISHQLVNASKRVSFVSYNMSLLSSQEVREMFDEVQRFIQDSFDIDNTAGKSHLF